MTTRRRLLTTALGSPLSFRLAQHAVAATDSPQPNVLFNFFPNGAAPEYFFPASSTPNLLPAMTAPLSNVAQSCSFIDGISLYQVAGEQTQRDLLTSGGANSIDNVIGAANTRKEVIRPVPNLRLGASSNSTAGFSNSYAAGQALAHEDNPRLAYQLLFGEGPSKEDAKNQSELKRTVGSDAATIVEQQLDALSALQLKIPPLNLRGLDSNRDFSRFEYDQMLATFVDLQQDILVMALSTGISHVGSLMIGHAGWSLAPFGSVEDQQAAYANSDGAAQIPYVNWYITRLANLLAKLSALPGQYSDSLLAETYVFSYSNVGSLNGSIHDRLPLILAGGSDFAHAGGLRYNFTDGSGDGEPLVRALNSIGQAMSIDTTTYESAAIKGVKDGAPLPGLLEATK